MYFGIGNSESHDSMVYAFTVLGALSLAGLVAGIVLWLLSLGQYSWLAIFSSGCRKAGCTCPKALSLGSWEEL